MTDRLAQVYIADLLDDDNVQLIEVWARVLYVRYKSGSPKFISKKGLSYDQEVYYRITEYKSLLKRYHPDKVSGGKKDKQTRAKNQRATEVAGLINSNRREMGFYEGVRRAVDPIRHLQQFRKYLTLFKTKAGVKLRNQLRNLCESRFRDCFKITTDETGALLSESEEEGNDFEAIKNIFSHFAKRYGGRIGSQTPDDFKYVIY